MEKIRAYLTGQSISSNDANSHSLFDKSFFGEKKGEKVIYSLAEALYLKEKEKIEILDLKNKPISKESLFKNRRLRA